METFKTRSFLIPCVLFLFLLSTMGTLSSCSASRHQSGWMDINHARSLDKKKGNKSKKLQKRYHKAHRR